ncbi:hypothetical protein AYI68_g101 [Smittium mucronatum]|uniref:Uncharacterized protein n=1 Tax=Smittium mucronatum TaxID=133383 RepID=A0A1R0H9A4_9FUNG|nr:hypothetical protein AYI68_g101 [Smittium mucronatum]
MDKSGVETTPEANILDFRRRSAALIKNPSTAKFKSIKRSSKVDLSNSPQLKKTKSQTPINSPHGSSSEHIKKSLFRSNRPFVNNSPRKFIPAPKFHIKPNPISKETDLNTFSFSPSRNGCKSPLSPNTSSPTIFVGQAKLSEIQNAWEAQFLQPVLNQLDRTISSHDKFCSELDDKSKEHASLILKLDSQVKLNQNINKKFALLSRDFEDATRECQNQSKVIDQLKEKNKDLISKSIYSNKQNKALWTSRLKSWSELKATIPGVDSFISREYNPIDIIEPLYSENPFNNSPEKQFSQPFFDKIWDSIYHDFSSLVYKLDELTKSSISKYIKLEQSLKKLESENSKLSKDLELSLSQNQTLKLSLESEKNKSFHLSELLDGANSKLSEWDSGLHFPPFTENNQSNHLKSHKRGKSLHKEIKDNVEGKDLSRKEKIIKNPLPHASSNNSDSDTIGSINSESNVLISLNLGENPGSSVSQYRKNLFLSSENPHSTCAKLAISYPSCDLTSQNSSSTTNYNDSKELNCPSTTNISHTLITNDVLDTCNLYSYNNFKKKANIDSVIGHDSVIKFLESKIASQSETITSLENQISDLNSHSNDLRYPKLKTGKETLKNKEIDVISPKLATEKKRVHDRIYSHTDRKYQINSILPNNSRCPSNAKSNIKDSVEKLSNSLISSSYAHSHNPGPDQPRYENFYENKNLKNNVQSAHVDNLAITKTQNSECSGEFGIRNRRNGFSQYSYQDLEHVSLDPAESESESITIRPSLWRFKKEYFAMNKLKMDQQDSLYEEDDDFTQR